jgi:transcriptional regulator with XRE-family HTH domain
LTPEKLKETRLASRLSQAALARRILVDVLTVSRWERGAMPIPAARARMLKAFFSMSEADREKRFPDSKKNS